MNADVLKGHAVKGVASLVKKAGGSQAAQQAASQLASKGADAAGAYLAKNKGKIIGKARKLLGFQAGGDIVLKDAGRARAKPKKGGRRKKKI